MTMNIHDWNSKLYPRNEETGAFLAENLGANFFWDNFGIKSAPKFRDECYSHIPSLWKDDVSLLIKSLQEKYDNKIDFIQIKEKFAYLTVYYDSSEKDKKDIDNRVEECRNILRSKGLHP